MNRRAMLAALGSAGAVATAGCAGLGSETISTPTEEQDAEGTTLLTFAADDGEAVATLAIDPGKQRESGAGGRQLPVRIAITHPDDTTITSVNLSLRAPPAGIGTTEIALETPFGTPHPSLELYTAPDDGATVLEIEDMGENGDGTVLFTFLLLGVGDGVSELAVDTEVGVAPSGLFGREYALNGLTLVPLPNGTGEAPGSVG